MQTKKNGLKIFVFFANLFMVLVGATFIYARQQKSSQLSQAPEDPQPSDQLNQAPEETQATVQPSDRLNQAPEETQAAVQPSDQLNQIAPQQQENLSQSKHPVVVQPPQPSKNVSTPVQKQVQPQISVPARPRPAAKTRTS